MDPQDLFYVALVVLWILSQLSSALKKGRRPGKAASRPPAERARPAPAAAPSVPAVRSVIAELERFEGFSESELSGLDERVRSRALLAFGAEAREEARRLREAVESAIARNDVPRVQREIANAQQALSRQRSLADSARILSTARRRPESSRPLAVADRLVQEIDGPLRAHFERNLLETPLPPAIAVIGEPWNDPRLRASPFAGSILFVPHSVSADPIAWSSFAPEVSAYLVRLAPGLHQEIHEELELSVNQEELASSPEAVVRLLFGSYLDSILADAVGASLFGAAYLRALSRIHGLESPARLTSIRLHPDGRVHPEPPAHLRMHLVAEWLAQSGLSGEAADALRDWNERLGHPDFFSFQGMAGRLPSGFLIDTATELLQALHQLELDALGSSTLASLPGLEGGARIQRESFRATEALLAGRSSEGSARALVAAAMDAASRSPQSAEAIREALHDSFRPREAPRVPPAGRRVPGRDAAAFPAFRAGSREIAEALILGEVLLAPKRIRFR